VSNQKSKQKLKVWYKKKKADILYFIDKDVDISRATMKSGGGKSGK
jgi:hypothetical protein